MASFPLVFLLLFCFRIAESAYIGEIITSFCNENSTLASAQMSANIDVVLAQLDANTAKNDGFSISTYGQGKDTVYGLGQCRKDVNSSACSTCIHNAAGYIRQSCYYSANSTDERIYYDSCLLRYSDQKFLGIFDPSIYINLPYGDKAHKVNKNPEFFRKQVGILMNDIISQAIVPGNKGFFGKGSIAISASETVYGVVQCTQDVSTSTCSTCLNTGLSNFPKLCRKLKTTGCRIQYGSCFLRYETDPF
ncbi:OLC1v1006647C1 [Oldenlandia corymbosa var. corymbosa]|uniref:OLC1v1006647C1 n=1 Tax=Oldenlandia corymbosa var. corymbosa TaxID=529605 RepID=A0AAV1DHI0_OLDCO|nr:OLC1v1006647C1 [Oldenlandia corymbosa var. corymbosa]